MLRPEAVVMVVMNRDDSPYKNAKASESQDGHSEVFLRAMGAEIILANLCMSRSFLAGHKQGRCKAERCGNQETHQQHPWGKDTMHVVMRSEAVEVVEVAARLEEDDAGDNEDDA